MSTRKCTRSELRTKRGRLHASCPWLFLSVVSFLLPLTGCASGKRWVNKPFVSSDESEGLRLYDPHAAKSRSPKQEGSRGLRAGKAESSQLSADGSPGPDADEEASERPQLRLRGTPSQAGTGTARVVDAPRDGKLLGVFRNTYYDFPAEFNYSLEGGARSIIHDRDCRAIAEVPAGFYGALCVQGSGTLASGQTVSFSRRDCSCAEVCPRTGQKICFDRLDQSEFPWGRGALGTAIIPLSTIAVDSKVIPLGTVVYIAEYDGVERHPGGNPHDGCFVAQDRGMKVVGKHVDVFTGNPSVTQHFNQLVPSNQGVHVYTGTARCQN